MVNAAFWQGKRVFITGHTGFKGAWLTATLLEMGAEITGYSLAPPTEPNLFSQLGLESKITHIEADINDRERIIGAIADTKPEIVLHLAAQSLVRYSYHHPLETFDTNVIGTLNVLEGIRQAGSVKSAVIITTDKCYENNDTGEFFKEGDKLGGKDPYSASKAAAEIVTNAYIQSYLSEENIPTASARAGNVIGGGDWAEDRLIPDVIRAYQAGETVKIRNPNATRPWQHVLEPLAGYMMLAEKLYADGDAVGGWNFGPERADIQPVQAVLDGLQQSIPFEVEYDTAPQPKEAALLALDITKAKAQLNWQPKLSLSHALDWTGSWYKQVLDGADATEITLGQIKEFYGL